MGLHQKNMSGPGSMKSNGIGTGYFMGGAPTELKAMALSNEQHPDEITMQAVGLTQQPHDDL